MNLFRSIAESWTTGHLKQRQNYTVNSRLSPIARVSHGIGMIETIIQLECARLFNYYSIANFLVSEFRFDSPCNVVCVSRIEKFVNFHIKCNRRFMEFAYFSTPIQFECMTLTAIAEMEFIDEIGGICAMDEWKHKCCIH